MIEIQIHEEADDSWNNRLLNSKIGSIYHTVEYANFIIHKGWTPKFIIFLDNTGKIVGQILLSTYSRFEKKGILKKIFSYLPGTKNQMYRWVFGPIIFDSKFKQQIYKKLFEYLSSQNCRVYGTEHPLESNVITKFNSKFSLTNWGTFLIDLSKTKNEIWTHLDKHSARKNIERSQNRGVQVNEMTFQDLKEYFELLKETKSKVNWDVDFDEITLLWNTLKSVGFTGFIAKFENMPIGGLLVSHFNNYINEWGVGRTDFDSLHKLYSQDLIKWKIIEWGINNKFHFYDLTGVNPSPQSQKEKGIFRYKQKWGGDLIKYQICEY
jgi:lipid II:glycine glycyltransferase (peptidoglycan interpeptide bridge formation enzyme)